MTCVDTECVYNRQHIHMLTHGRGHAPAFVHSVACLAHA